MLTFCGACYCEEERVATWTLCTPCFAKTDCSLFMKTLFWSTIQAEAFEHFLQL